VSLISYWISIKLFKRDDIVFGPRPGIIRLLIEFIGIKKGRN
jgi:ABC-2 type transport system permease protein